MNNLDCPYCSHCFDLPHHDDGYGYKEDVTEEVQCPECDKNFVFSTSISFHYSTYQANCLNGADHPWKPTHSHPVEYTRMVCPDCDIRREMTKEEKKKYLEWDDMWRDSIKWEEFDKNWFWCDRCKSYQEGQCICYAR